MDERVIRHLGRKVIPIALGVNVVLNALTALALYRRRVPIVGHGSIADDTFVAAFFIGAITWLAVTPAARREARAGRARGGGVGWLAWTERHRVVSALGFGLIASPALAWPAVAALAARQVYSLSAAHFAVFKAAFAGAAGVVTAVAAALVATAAIPPADTDDPRWCKDPARSDGPAWPCDYIDKGGLAVTDGARGCSGTPTWQLVVRGALDPAHVRVALADTVARYPSLRCKVQALDGVPPHARRYRWAADPGFAVGDLFAVVDLRHDPGALPALVREVHNRPLDLYRDLPVTLTMALTGADGCRLLFRQHHAIADGRAFIGLLADFARYLEAARAGRRPSAAELAPIGRRSELDALALPTLRRLRYLAAGYLWVVGNYLRSVVWPVAPFTQNLGNDYRGENGTVHWIVGDAILERWNRARKQLGVSLNSLLTAALVAANQRWHRAAGKRLGRTRGNIIMETRPRDGSFVSFANHLATLDVAVDLGRVDDVAELARRFQRQVAAQRQRALPQKRLVAERRIVLGMSVAQMQRWVFETRRTQSNFNISNLIALEFPTLGGDGWTVQEVLITTPVTPRTGMALTVIRYHGQLVFNFNYKSSAITRAQTEELCRAFQAVLAELPDQ